MFSIYLHLVYAGFNNPFLFFIPCTTSPTSYLVWATWDFALFRRILDTDIIFLLFWLFHRQVVATSLLALFSRIWGVLTKQWVFACNTSHLLFIRKLYHKFDKQQHRKYSRMCMQDRPSHFLTQRLVPVFALVNSAMKNL